MIMELIGGIIMESHLISCVYVTNTHSAGPQCQPAQLCPPSPIMFLRLLALLTSSVVLGYCTHVLSPPAV